MKYIYLLTALIGLSGCCKCEQKKPEPTYWVTLMDQSQHTGWQCWPCASNLWQGPTYCRFEYNGKQVRIYGPCLVTEN